MGMGGISFIVWAIAIVVIISLFVRTGALRAETDRLKDRVRDLENALANMQAWLKSAERAAEPTQTRAPAPAKVEIKAVAAAMPKTDEPPVEKTPAPHQPTPTLHKDDWEKTFAENWLVWVGGVTLALGGAFLEIGRASCRE